MASNARPRLIEGRHHPLVKEVRRMVRSGELLTGGMILLETARLVEDALKSGFEIPKAFISSAAGAGARNLVKHLPATTEIYQLPPQIFSSLASTEAVQDILALAVAPRWQEEDLFASAPALLLVLAGVQDPGNLGAILRAGEAFGATGMILTKGTVSPYNTKAVRAAAGAVLRVPMMRNLSAAQTVALLARRKVRLFTSVVQGGRQMPGIDFSGSLAVAVGSEGSGLPKELAAAGQQFTIPILPAVESLNAAAATAITLYEIARQRNFNGVVRR